jgi:ABC-type multidrug transport system permease subunit
MRSREIFELARMRVLLLLREPEAVFWVFVFPIMLSVVLGFAFKNQERDVPRVVVAPSDAARRWIPALVGSERVEVLQAASAEEAERRLRTGAAEILFAGGEPPLLRYDPTRPEGHAARLEVEDVLQRAAGRGDAVALRVEELRERGSRYIDWLVPGLLGLSLMSTGIWGIGLAIVEAREHRLLERFLVTPMARSSFLLSFGLSRLTFMVFEVLALVLFARFVLGVPLRGSALEFGALCLVGATCFAGLGLLIGSRAKTAAGVAGLIYLTMMPMGLSSGVFFSYEKFSATLQVLIRLLPLTALNDSLRALMLEGAGMASVLPQIGIQAAWGAGAFAVALRIFRWR